MDQEARAAFEIKYKYSRAFWLGIAGFQVACIVLIWSIKPAAFDLMFSSPVMDDNRVYVIIVALISIWTFCGLRKKNEFASYVLDLRDTERLTIGYLYPPMMPLSITCWGLLLALSFEYAYSFLWFAVGLLHTLRTSKAGKV